jgi:Recombinase zinc beta ribbon domain
MIFHAIIKGPFQGFFILFDESQKNKNILQQGKSNLTLLGITKCGCCGKNLTSTYTKKSTWKYYYYYKCVSTINGSKIYAMLKIKEQTNWKNLQKNNKSNWK